MLIGRILAVIAPVGITHRIGMVLISAKIAQVFVGLVVDETRGISLHNACHQKGK